MRGTGGGSPTTEVLTELETAYLSILTREAVVGDELLPEGGAPPPPAPAAAIAPISPPLSPMVEIVFCEANFQEVDDVEVCTCKV